MSLDFKIPEPHPLISWKTCRSRKIQTPQPRDDESEIQIYMTLFNKWMVTVFPSNLGEVVVTTPYNLLRVLEHNTGLLCRLCHLVLDEIEVLFSDTAEQVNGLHNHLAKCCSSCAHVWNSGTHWGKQHCKWVYGKPLFFLFIFVFAHYCVGRLGLSFSYQLVFAECLCPLRSALSRLFILQIWTDPFPEISIFSGQNPALQLHAQAYAVTTCCPVAFSCFIQKAG